MHFTIVVQVKHCGLQLIDLTLKTITRATLILIKIAENNK